MPFALVQEIQLSTQQAEELWRRLCAEGQAVGEPRQVEQLFHAIRHIHAHRPYWVHPRLAGPKIRGGVVARANQVRGMGGCRRPQLSCSLCAELAPGRNSRVC